MFSGSFTDARAQLAVGHSQRTAGAGHSATPAVDTERSLPRVAPPSNSCRDSGPAALALGPPVTSSHGIPSPTLFSGHHQHTNNTPITRYILICYQVSRNTSIPAVSSRPGLAQGGPNAMAPLPSSSVNAVHQCIYHRIPAISHTAYTSLNLSLSAQNPAPAA